VPGSASAPGSSAALSSATCVSRIAAGKPIRSRWWKN
jgi:hypothetical protein